jgi:hypothetical protein
MLSYPVLFVYGQHLRAMFLHCQMDVIYEIVNQNDFLKMHIYGR